MKYRPSSNLFALLASAAVAAAFLTALSGCSGNTTLVAAPLTTTTTTTGTTTTSSGGVVDTMVFVPYGFAAANVYAFQSPSTGNASILQFAATSSGSVAPTSTLALPTPKDISWDGITTDSKGQIYAWGNQIAASPSEILVYPAGSLATATPSRTILGGAATFPFTSDVVVDSSGQIYVETGDAVMGNSAIVVFAASQNGTTTPTRTIEGSLTGLDGSGHMAVDAAGYLYISNDTNTPGEIRVFSPTATGNVAPTRVIAGSSTLLTTWILGIDVDLAGDVFAVVWLPASNSTEVVEFAAGASGNVAPTRIITGPINGVQPVNVRVDGAGQVFVLCENLSSSGPGAPFSVSPFIAVFPSPAFGSTTPTAQFNSTAWTAPTGNFALY